MSKLQRCVLAASLGLGLGLTVAPPVLAATSAVVVHIAPMVGDDDVVPEDVSTPVGPDAQVETDALDLQPFTVELILGFFIPLLTAFLTKATWSGPVKTLVAAGLAAVVGAITVSITPGGGAVISQDTVQSAALAFGTAIIAFVSVWAPARLTSRPGDKLATVGVK
jgi:hypothetical protein